MLIKFINILNIYNLNILFIKVENLFKKSYIFLLAAILYI